MKQEVAKILAEALKKLKLDIKEEEIERYLEVPPSADLGDYAFPCFFLASKLKNDPKQIAIELREKIPDNKDFDDIQTSGSYINFFVNRKDLALNIIKEILSKKEKYGSSDIGKGKKTMVEFSQANTHKAFHVGHIRGTSLGESLARISEFCSEKVIRADYQGDTGMHVAKWLWCYKKYHSREKLKKDESWIASIYVDAVKRLSKNKKLQEEVDVINKKLEEGKDKKLLSIWKKTRKLSLDSFQKIYKDLNTHFDKYYFESEVEDQGKKIAKDLLKRGIAKFSDGATIMDLNEYCLSVWVLLRKDGTVLYSSKDLYLAERKFTENNLDNSLYVVADEQNLHFLQLFKTLELMEFKDAKKAKHIPFGLVRLPTGKMSSRTGDNILYSDFIKEVIDYAKKGIAERYPKISKKDIETRARKIAIASIKFSMLKQSPNKIIVFDKKEALSFEGDTGPYLQYSYARANSILKKAKKKQSEILISSLEQKEIELSIKLSQFPEVISKAHEHLNPALIANYAYQLSQVFNEFYHACPVIGSDKESFRLSLVKAFKQVLENSLYLLGIETLEEM